jgi:exosortase/archaeosortase family protein
MHMGRKDKIVQKKLQQQQKEKFKLLMKYLSPILWAFVVWFAAISIIHTPWFKDPVREFFVSITTHSAYWFGKILFVPIQMPAVPYLSVKGFNMQVVMECTAYNFYLFAIIITIFARWKLRHKFISLGIFLLVIFILNNMRFVSMGYLGSYRPDLFDTVHDYVWNILFGFMVFGIWAWREIMAQDALKKAEESQ